ncbi:MAG: phenylalanine--tRNA ligase subunit alpha [Chloroflexota bacterium]
MEQIRADALHAINEAGTSRELENVRVQHTGKRSKLSQSMQVMAELDPEQRKRFGAEVNGAKQDIERALEERTAEILHSELEQRLEAEAVDVTLPGATYVQGYRHPLYQAVREILGILRQMGFAVVEGPEVEWEKYNFDMLNIPSFHPARDSQDTFWITETMLLRTQTSPAQVRFMEANAPPVRIAAPGWVFRNEAEDASHGDRFYQIEGLAVDRDISLGDLKGVLTELARRYFGSDRRVRFRPSFFPFTEPSAELDIECVVCKGKGCRSCGGEGWLELGGSGMVHPRVLQWSGYDPESVSGFAFGIGPDRFAMMRYGITDLRLFRENDLRFLRQFS